MIMRGYSDPSEHEGAGGETGGTLADLTRGDSGVGHEEIPCGGGRIQLGCGERGLAAPGALAATQSAGSALGTVAGMSGHSGVRAPLARPAAASGRGWSIVPSPNPLARTGQLAGVSCASSS